MIRILSFSLLALAFLAPGALAEEITVTREDCAGLVIHVPDANVAYQPGVDANGNQVASADLGGGFIYEAPTDFSFNVTINPIDYQRTRALQANRAALAAQQSTAASTAETLETDASALQDTKESLATTESSLEAEDAAVLATFETASETIVGNTGGESPTAAQLTARAAALDQLHTNTFDDPTYTDLRERIALNQEDQATNEAEIAANESDQSTNNATVQSLAQDRDRGPGCREVCRLVDSVGHSAYGHTTQHGATSADPMGERLPVARAAPGSDDGHSRAIE